MTNSQGSVRQYIQKFILSRKFAVKPSTFVSDKSKANILARYFGSTPIESVRHSDIIEMLDELHEHYSNKSINAFLTILRAVFQRAERDGVIARNPMLGIKNVKTLKPTPNPFTKTELSQLSQTDACEHGKNAFELNVYTGLRISELLALSWEDIDWDKKTLFVRRAKVLQNYKVTKTTDSTRKVELNDLAIAVLRKQWSLTGNNEVIQISVLQDDNKSYVTESVRIVFYNSQTDQPFLHAAQFNTAFFRAFLEKSGVAHRGVSQLRHTFASQNLTAGISKDWIAMQMGHTDTGMIDSHYGQWIPADSPNYSQASARHLAQAFGHALPDLSPEKDSVLFGHEYASLISALQAKPELLALVKAVAGGVS